MILLRNARIKLSKDIKSDDEEEEDDDDDDDENVLNVLCTAHKNCTTHGINDRTLHNISSKQVTHEFRSSCIIRHII